MTKKKTHEEFVAQLKELQPELEVVSRYNGAKAKVLVRSKYGECLMFGPSLLRGNSPSIRSAINKTEYWINQAMEVHDDKYDYSGSEYINHKTKIRIICPKHGEFWQIPKLHLDGHGCRACSCDKRIYSLSKFINMANNVHNYKFNYSKVNYKHSKIKVCIICPIHGEFYQEPNTHLRGKGCLMCSVDNLGCGRSRFIIRSKGRSCLLYKIRCWNDNEEFYKIGITSLSIKDRFKGNSLPYNYEVVSEIKGEAGEIWDLELVEKRKHIKFKYKPLINFIGKTECFTKLIS